MGGMAPKMLPVQVLVLLLQILGLSQSIEFTLPDPIGNLRNISTSILNLDLLPTPEGIFELSKDVVAGYPFQIVSSTVNFICSKALSTNVIRPKFTPDINLMNFQLQTACTKADFPLTNAEEMWMSPLFDPKKKVVILATGWTTTVNGSDTIEELSRAYNCRGDVNFVAVDAARFVDTLYTWSAFNTEEIGENIALGLVKLLDVMPVENIHLIGHSLGAHIVGSAGRHLQRLTGKIVPRITGLDPAKPCFNEGEVLSGLLRGDARFIDVIHSNSGVLGKRDPLGDVDFYPGGLGPLPVGCVLVTCAHARAWQYFTETVYPGNERNFLAARCTSLSGLRQSLCRSEEVPMGYAVPHNVKGNYFLEVRGNSPFGMNSSPVRSSHLGQCGQCPEASTITVAPTTRSSWRFGF
ncbi:vitellogenin-1-like [Drosophila elegans]|uniref:vitellogenin-1-like n=1 Tax=Drosophila elegans TaxID=30023 RepID=UPI0007E6E07E|nr:vitellogenin-1-like [Drosophila elegans]